MTQEVNAHISFNENCEYKASSTDVKVNIEPQDVNLSLTVTNLTRNNEPYYYDDTLEIEAYVSQQLESFTRNIQTGRIEFYYIPTTSNTPILLNDDKNSCILSQQGTAKLQFKPNQPGTIKAKYINNKWYKTAETSIGINLLPIPVTINFTKKPPYLVDLEDSVELEVTVKKTHNGELLNYGVVTFLHYVEHFDTENPNKRIEHVIGNPVLVKDGKASIKYIPVQEYSDIEPIKLVDGTEYIRAFYNYDNDLYFTEENETYSYETIQPNNPTSQWKYFETANVYTNIEVLKPNSIGLEINNKNIDKDGRYHYSEIDDIEIIAKLYDEDGEIISLSNEDIKSLNLHIIGTYLTVDKNCILGTKECISYHEYERTLSVSEYNTNNKCFVATVSNLKPGNYTIQASTQGQIINGTVIDMYHSTETSTIVENVNGEEHIKYDTDEIRTDTYLDSIDMSNIVYINVDFKNIDYSILSSSDDIIKTKSTVNNYISNEVIIDDTYKEILNGETCYFFSYKTSTTYIGELVYSDNKLIGRPINDISFSTADNYPLCMYIPSSYYTDNESTNFYLEYTQSNTNILHIRDDISLQLEYVFISDTSFGEIQYTVSSNDIFKDDTINITVTLVKGNSNVIKTYNHILSSYVNTLDNIIDRLEPGEYTLTATIDGTDISDSKTFTINSAALTQTLQTNSKIIRATPYGTVHLVISSSSMDLTVLELNKLFVYISVGEFNINYAKKLKYKIDFDVLYVTKDSIYIVADAGTYVPSKLFISAYYQGDNNVHETLCEPPEECKTLLIEPKLTVYNETNQSMYFTLNDERIKGITIIGKVNFYNNTTKVGETKVFITTDETYGYIDNIPETCNNVELIINPYDAELIDIILSDDPSQELSNNYVVDTICTTYSDDEICNLYDIIDQYEESNGQCLFPLFNQQEPLKFTRKIL